MTRTGGGGNWRRWTTAVFAAACCALAVVPQPQLSASTNTDAARAHASYAAMQRFFYRKAARLYAPAHPGIAARPYSHLWPFSQALAATVAIAMLPDGGAATALRSRIGSAA
ncbi:MAG TPA: hypothetical protein VE753_04510 [Gaiellaceae bacterium]|nr:hypothetical protein [Gaiellaceae bacterium]